VRDFASRRGASEVKWLESNGEQKKSEGPTCLDGARAGEQTPVLHGRGEQAHALTNRRAQVAEGPAPYSAALQDEAKEAAGPRPAVDGSCSGQDPMAGRRGWDGEEEGG